MKRHEEMERILASYRDATAEEQAAAQAHMKGCPACAERYEAYARVDASVAGLAQPELPARLARPLAAVLADAGRPPKAKTPPSLTLRAFAPAGLVVFVVAALSMVVWSVSSVKPQVTTTPTLTLTLTPTTIATIETETEPASYLQIDPLAGHAVGDGSLNGRSLSGVNAGEPDPTPAPVPAPAAVHSPVLFAGYGARARITN